MHDSTTMPRYSIIVAAYNVANEIDACLTSLTSTRLKNCEIIVVNDGSTDNTGAHIAAFADDPRVRIVEKANGGVSDARNTGLDYAKGDYISFVDGDDWVEPNLTEAFDAALRLTPTADLLVFGINEIDQGTVRTSLWRAEFDAMTNSPCNKLFARPLFNDVRFDRGVRYEDLALIPALFLRAQNPVTVQLALYNYRRDRAASFMQSTDINALYELGDSAARCIARIQADASTGRIQPPEQTLGRDWLARFETTQIFIPGVLHRSRRITDRSTRHLYIRNMLARLPDSRRIRLTEIYRGYGTKMAVGALLYRRGWIATGHFLLHDTGQIKRAITSRFKWLR